MGYTVAGFVGQSPAIAIHTLQTDDRWRDGLPVLNGDLVSLREVSFVDVPSLYVLIASDPEVTAHISAPPPSIRAFQGFVSWAQRERAAGKVLCYAVLPKGSQHAVGLFQIRKLQPDFFTAEWGFVLGSRFWSTGIFEDAAILVADFAFDTLGVHRLEGRAVTHNGRGNGALTKLGAKAEARLREALQQEDVALPQYLWTIRAVEWQERRAMVRRRFSAAAVERQIQDAITDVQRQLAASAPPASSPATIPLYPFFVSDNPNDEDD